MRLREKIVASHCDWETVGAFHPYWGVLTREIFYGKDLPHLLKDYFFITGEEDVSQYLQKASRYFGDEVQGHALDFGCGVGRLLIPLSLQFQSVVGIDVSTSMLAEAEKNCRLHARHNFQLFSSLSRVKDQQFDFICSRMVFQHIPCKEGKKLLAQLLDLLKPGGVGVIHLATDCRFSLKRRLKEWGQRNFQFIHYLCNFLEKKPKDLPFIPMYAYDLKEIFPLFASKKLFVEVTQEGPVTGVLIYYQK